MTEKKDNLTDVVEELEKLEPQIPEQKLEEKKEEQVIDSSGEVITLGEKDGKKQ